AIMFCVTGKSFRADQDRETITWSKELSAVSCQLSDGNEETKLELFLTQGEVQGQKAPIKKYLVNGVPRRQIDFVGNLRAVLFWPEHLELVTDSPSLRRRYLDSVLVQVDREYRRNLMSYERGLRQRNRLLDLINEGKAERPQLLFWDQLLIKAGGYITDKRGEYIDFVNSYQLSAISYQIQYDKSVISESRLEQYKDEEVGAKATLVGPHRDDFTIFKDERELSKYGSRGEQRLAVLWLKLAELSYVEKEAGDRPVLLLDDIFSELDEKYRHLVLDVIGKQQTIITSAEDNMVDLVRRAKGMQPMIIQL
ncbi:MAG: DNA replication and repair protein RecF, partial [Patescibacteria group bacterium]